MEVVAPALRPAPLRYRGKFADFYEQHVAPNLPTAERVASFDALLARYLSDPDACHFVRKVGNLERRSTYLTKSGQRLLPTDNAPAWWLHAVLASATPLPDEPAELFERVPRHMFDMRIKPNLNGTGFHLAHLSNVNNRDLAWETWDRAELIRRMTLNIHPFNWCLVAKHDWQQHGGRDDILSYIGSVYEARYGDLYRNWPWRRPKAAADPWYEYDAGLRPRLAGTTSVGGVLPAHEDGAVVSLNRPSVRREWGSRNIQLRIHTGGLEYLVPHDDLLNWVLTCTNVANTSSWTSRGYYSWPRASADMLAFLAAYRT